MKSEGQPSNGSPKPDGIKGTGSVLSPEICIVVDYRITSRSLGGKADSLNLLEGSSPVHAKASVQDTTGV